VSQTDPTLAERLRAAIDLLEQVAAGLSILHVCHEDGCKEVERPTDRSHAAWKMGEGPPRTGCRASSQTTRRCVGMRSQVVNGSGKGEARPRQVRGRKANASELLMSCRNAHNCHRKQIAFGVCEEVQREPAYWLGGGRQIDGAILVQAFMRNVGTWRSDVKGEAQGARTPRVRVPRRSAGADQLVVVMKPGNAGGAKGLNRPATEMGQPGRGGAHV